MVRAVLDEGGNARATWPIRRVLAVADRSTGTTVVSELYDRRARRRGHVDLDGLWAQLGVVPRGDGGVLLEDDAPLATVRRSMLRLEHLP